ncbi:MAG: hypothetical protein HY907_15705 [Deltaproteobacteria bacterium]|nr:hypothetical protein [Deltaproteobacteria bacterium]
MKLVCLAWIGMGLAVGAGCKSSAECAKCACDGGGVGAAAQTPMGAEKAKGLPTQPVEPGEAVDRMAAAPASSVKCAPGVACETEPTAMPDPRGPKNEIEEPATGSRPLVPPTGPVAPVELGPAGEPLAPGLAAHLGRIPGTADMVFVLQADVRALLTAEQVRESFRSAVALMAGEVPGDLSCAAELVAAVDLVTVAVFEDDEARDAAVIVLEGGADLPGVIECAGRILPGEVPDEAAAQASRGYVEIEGDFALGSLGPRTIVAGDPELVMEMRAGRVRQPLSSSAEFLAAQRVAGTGPVMAVALVNDARGDDDESFAGGAVLRTSPRLEATGTFTFASMEMVGEVVDEFTEAVGEMDHDRAMILRELSRAPGGAELAGELVGLLDAAVDARLTIQGRTLSFEVRAPEGVTAAGLAGTLARGVPLLLLRGGDFGPGAFEPPPPDVPVTAPPAAVSAMPVPPPTAIE